MTYRDMFVAEVKYKGKILRVKEDIVYLPFGSEYSILLKNLNSKKALVKISIDGQDVLGNSGLILVPNSSTELEGFLNGTIAKNRFKFIQKTRQIQDHRGDKIDDGMIRVEFAYEKENEFPKTIIYDHHQRYHYYNQSCGCSNDNIKGITRSYKTQDSTDNFNTSNIRSCYNVSENTNISQLGIESIGAPLNDEGITVKGSECNQSFTYGSIGEVDESKIIILRLKGITSFGNDIQKPITVKDKIKCSTCGFKSNSSFKFCPQCGAFLE